MCTVSKDVQSIEKNLPSCYDWLVVKKYRYLKQDKSKNCMNKLLKRSDLKNDAEDSKIWRCDVYTSTSVRICRYLSRNRYSVYNTGDHGKSGSTHQQACGTNAGMYSYKVDGQYLTSYHCFSQYHCQSESLYLTSLKEH